MKETYKKTLEEVKIKRWWAQFVRNLHKLVLNYNQLQYCTVSLHFIRNNFEVIKEICNGEPDCWNEFAVLNGPAGFITLRITFRVFLSDKQTDGKGV